GTASTQELCVAPTGTLPALSLAAARPRSAGLAALGDTGRVARRLQDFVTGPGNWVAHAAAKEMVESGGTAFNPLVIHGSIGMGKSHLLEGLGRAFKEKHPTLYFLHVTAESFTNGFLDAMRSGSLTAFRTRHRTAGGLLVDDVHFLAAKRATQDEFLHTFNALANKGSPIVVTADQHPRSIAKLTEELATRLLGGMIVKIDLPDFATRCA